MDRHTLNTDSPVTIVRLIINRLRKRHGDDPATLRDLQMAEDAMVRVRYHARLQREAVVRADPTRPPPHLKPAARDLLRLLEDHRLDGVAPAELAVFNCNYRARVSELRAAGHDVVHDRARGRYVLRDPGAGAGPLAVAS